MAEIIVALSIMAMLITCMALSLNGIVKFNRYQLVRQQCIAAAQAELDSFTAMGGPIPNEDFGRLWPELRVSIEEMPGTGQWQDMELVKVTTSGKYLRKLVKIESSRYIRRNPPLEEGK